jgi:hypothetical protein
MNDELVRLHNKPNLLLLLKHYADLGRESWQDRLMTMEGVESPELSKLHGELIAFSWIDQNTGVFSVLRAGAVPNCYRVTPTGLRALQQIQSPDSVLEPEIIEEKPIVKKFKKKREKCPEPEVVVSAAA